MKYLGKALAVTSLTILASIDTVQPTPAADNDGKTLRAYLAIPFNGTTARQDDLQIGLQMLQGIKHTDSGPLEKFSDLSVFDISFNGHGLTRTNVMGIDMMAAFNLT